jgi:hypothetical protein
MSELEMCKLTMLVVSLLLIKLALARISAHLTSLFFLKKKKHFDSDIQSVRVLADNNQFNVFIKVEKLTYTSLFLY